MTPKKGASGRYSWEIRTSIKSAPAKDAEVLRNESTEKDSSSEQNQMSKHVDVDLNMSGVQSLKRLTFLLSTDSGLRHS